MEELQALNAKVIKDIEGMPWQDPSMPKEQLLQSVKYFIKVYKNGVEKLLEEKK